MKTKKTEEKDYCTCTDCSVTCPKGIESLHCIYCGKPTRAVRNINQKKNNEFYGMDTKELNKAMDDMECWSAQMHIKKCEKCSPNYSKITSDGNMDDMFDFAYALGQKHQLEKEVEKLKTQTKES